MTIEQGLLDFGLEEEVTHEPKETNQKGKGKRKKEKGAETAEVKAGNGEGNGAEPVPTEAGESSGSDSGKDDRTEPRGNAGAGKNTGFEEGQWHQNIIGTPKGRVNSYFQGVVTHEKGFDKQILVPFKDVKAITKQVYVDDIYAVNPTELVVHNWVIGSFPDVISLVTDEAFVEMQSHPELKGIKVRYQYVSLHGEKKRVYELTHPNKPTEAELKKLDAKIDEIEWAGLSDSERKKRKEQAKLAGKSVPQVEEEPFTLPDDPFAPPEEADEQEDTAATE